MKMHKKNKINRYLTLSKIDIIIIVYFEKLHISL